MYSFPYFLSALIANVSIVKKPLSDGRVSLILEYCQNGQRIKQTLKIYVNPKDEKSPNPTLRNAYKEAIRSVEILPNEVEGRLMELLPVNSQYFAQKSNYFFQSCPLLF